MSYKTEIQKLFDLQKFGMKFGLDGMRGLLASLGDPHQGRKFVHLAGTNGKGSVGTMLQAMLTRAGYRVGLYTSPHLITFRERMKVGGTMISEADTLRLAERIWRVCDPASQPTFFEFVTAMAFLYFQEQGTDLDIIEAGLGGRLDSTNVITPLAAAITNISLEHIEHLGDTVAKIAAEKAGIIKPGVPVVAGALVPEAREVILSTAAERRSPAFLLDRDFTAAAAGAGQDGRQTIDFTFGKRSLPGLALNLAGPHQADNAAVALALVFSLAESGFPVEEKAIRDGLATAVWPGRAETWPPRSWPPEGPAANAPLLLDGAHNPDGARALARLLAGRPRRRLFLIVGVMADKDVSGVLGPIIAQADRLLLTRPAFSRAASPELLLDKVVAAFGTPKAPTTLHPAIPEALAAAAREAAPEDLVVVSGSLFTVGETRAYLERIAEVESN